MRITLNLTTIDIPELNQDTPLPLPDFLPADVETSKERWKKEAWNNPSRQSREQPIKSFKRKDNAGDIASVRRHLIAQDIDSKKHQEALSYADGDFYDVGNLQADHLQPSESILKRQLEMIHAMNLDPLFKEKIYAHPNKDDFFIEKNGAVLGTQYFFSLYHNCIGNLWLISAADNTGHAGKGSQDAIQWLTEHPRFVKAFFDDHGGAAANLDKTKILYEIKKPEAPQESTILAEAARTWFRKKYDSEIKATGYIQYEISQPAKGLSTHVFSYGKNKQQRLKYMVKLALAKAVLTRSRRNSSGSSNNGQSTSLASSDVEPSETNMAILSEAAQTIREGIATARTNMKKEYLKRKAKKSNNI